MTKRALSKVVMLKTSLCSSYKQFFYFILFYFYRGPFFYFFTTIETWESTSQSTINTLERWAHWTSM